MSEIVEAELLPDDGTPGLAVTVPAELSASHVQMVILAMTGQFDIPTLAKNFGLKQVEVEAVLSHPQADKIRKDAVARVREELLFQQDDLMVVMENLAFASLKRTLAANISPTHKSKPNQDRVALEFLKGRRVLSPQEEAAVPKVQLTAEQYDGLVGGMEKSDRIRDLTVSPVTEARESSTQ